MSNVVGPVALASWSVTPPFFIGWKYQVAAVPYVLLAAMYLFTKLQRPWVVTGMAAMAAVMLIASVRFIGLEWSARDDSVMSATSVLATVPRTDLVVADVTAVGLVFPIALSWPPEQKVIIGPQSALANDDALSEQVRGASSVAYVSNLKYGGTEQARHRILTRLRYGLGSPTTTEAPPPVVGLGCTGCGHGYQIYVVRRGFP